jgi:thioredoxin 1
MANIFDADDSNFDAEVLRADRPVLVDFSATWCGPCKKIEPLVHEIAAEYDGRLKVVKVDVDRARDTAAKFAVMAVPTLLLIRDGKVRDELRGLVAKRVIAERVERVL